MSPEERLKREKEQAKEEDTKDGSKSKRSSSRDKKEKKRTNDSGTSSKDSSARIKEKKKVRFKIIKYNICDWFLYAIPSHYDLYYPNLQISIIITT